MKTIRVFTLAPAICLLALITFAAAWAQPAASATDSERAFAADVARFINQERAARGLAPVTWTFDEALRTHMSTTCLTHSPQNEGLEVVTCVYPNAGQPGGAAGGAVYKWMKSPAHNGSLMYPASGWIKVGVYCDPGTGIAHVGVIAGPDWDNPSGGGGGPISDYYLDGAQCPGAAPATTSPPVTTPPSPVTVPPASVAPGGASTPGAMPGGSDPAGREPVGVSPSTPTVSDSNVDSPTPADLVEPTSDPAGAGAAGAGAAVVVPTSARLRDPDHSTYTSQPTTTAQSQTPPPSLADVASGSSSGTSTMAVWIVAAAAVGIGSLTVMVVRLRRRHPAVPAP